jgi:hypothetical protein
MERAPHSGADSTILNYPWRTFDGSLAGRIAVTYGRASETAAMSTKPQEAHMRQRAWPIPALLIGTLSVLSASCSKPSRPTGELSLTRWLDVCSPLEAADEHRMLIFSGDHSVVLREDLEGYVPQSKRAAKVTGRWSGQDIGRAVNVEISGIARATPSICRQVSNNAS